MDVSIIKTDACRQHGVPGDLKRILRLDRLRLRGVSGTTDEFTLAATVQHLRRLAKLISHGPPVMG